MRQPMTFNIVNTVDIKTSPEPSNPIPATSHCGPHPDARKLTAQSASKPKQSTKGDKKGSGPKPKYNSHDLVLITRAVVKEMPFLQPYGEKTNSWKRISMMVGDNGFLQSRNPNQIRQKAEALVHYKKDQFEASTDEKVKAIRAVLKNSTDAITIAALLERMEKQWDDAQEATESKKSELRKKHEADCIGGEAIHCASMQSLSQRCKRMAKEMDAVKTDTDTDTDTKPIPSANTLQSSVVEVRKVKCRRIGDTSLEFKEELLATLKQDRISREVYQKETATRLGNFMESSKKQGEEIQDILQGFLDIKRERQLARQPSVEV